MRDPLGKQVDHFFLLRERKRHLESQLEAVEQEIRDREMELMASMDAQGISKITGMSATVSISESVKPSVEDWAEFEDYIHANR